MSGAAGDHATSRPRPGRLWPERPWLSVAVAGLATLAIIAAAGLSGPARLPGPRLSHHAGSQAAGGAGNSGPGAVSQGAGGSLTTSQHVPHVDALWPLIGLVVLALAVGAILLWRRLARRRGRATPHLQRPATGRALGVELPEPEPEPDAEPLAEDVAAVLAELESSRESSDAIIRAWLSLEAAAERSGVIRRRAETPTEFTTRVIGRALGEEGAIRALLALYLRARFSDAPPRPAELEAVRAALGRLLASWRAGHPEPVGAGRRR